MNILSRFRMPSLENMASAIRRRFDEFDFDSIEKQLTELGNDMEKAVSRLKKRIKNLTDKFVVEVPFDKETQKISFSFDGNVMEVKTETYSDAPHLVSTTSVTIPSDVNTDTLIQKYDEENKKMQFIFFKWGAPVEEDNVEVEIEVDENDVTVDDQVDETATTASANVMPTFETTSTVSEKDALMETIMRMYAEGHSYRKIASEVGVSDKTVARWIKKVLAEIRNQEE